MRRSSRHPGLGLVPLMLLGAGVLVMLANAWAAPPKIESIEPFLGDRVLIHFYMDPNLTYELQYTETLSNGVPGGTWTNLVVIQNNEDMNHYIAVDTGTRKQRFYRLHVHP